MSTTTTQSTLTQPPDLLAILLPFFEKAAPHEHRILLAMLERFAAEHYRRWAAQEADPARKQGFLACAAREEFIAETVEGLDRNAQRIAQSLRERFPEIRQVYADAMHPLSNEAQWKAQAAGELGGARLYRDFAAAETDPDAREKLLLCVVKEEESARFLETLA
jgi:hypothetical protein